MKKIIVIGGGAAGMMSAWWAKQKHTQVTILEAGEKVGKKLLATGNGKCNLTYAYEVPQIAYRGENPSFAESVIRAFDQPRTLHFFEDLGMLMHEKNHGIYPFTDQAQTVQTLLLDSLQKRGVKIKTRERVVDILEKNDDSGFLLKTESWQYEADAVIFACGSKAAPALGALEDGYTLAKKLGHPVTELLPALVPLKTKETVTHSLAGLRSSAKIRLLIDGKETAESSGELQWTSYGISGIVVFQISRFVGSACARKQKVQVILDLLPEIDTEQVLGLLEKQKNARAERMLSGIFPQKLISVLLKRSGYKANEILEKEQLKEILTLASNLCLTITGTRSFEYAQICAGGIDTSFVDYLTLESKKIPQLYFAGEVLDVDGACGGYNLQWAWSSGYVAGIHAAKEKRQEEVYDPNFTA